MFYQYLFIFMVFNISLFAQRPGSHIILEKAVSQEVRSVDVLGITEKKLIPVKKVQRGATLIYINRVINRSRVSEKGLVVLNPIPLKTIYLKGSATCERECQVLFSIDGGKHFSKEENLKKFT